jgi:hypothetical protein
MLRQNIDVDKLHEQLSIELNGNELSVSINDKAIAKLTIQSKQIDVDISKENVCSLAMRYLDDEV